MGSQAARFVRDTRGASMVEFAIIGPILLMLVIAMLQLGMLFFAQTGLKSAVGEGARYATVYPRPSDAKIRARITQKRFGLEPALLTGPTFTHGYVDGRDSVDISMTYNASVRFLFIPVTTISMTEQRRAYVHPL